MASVRDRQEALFGRGEGVERIAFFSDAVFAIALTLLVLDIRLPEGLDDADVGPAIAQLWPQFFAYGLTFLVLGQNWVSHHRKYRVIERFDTRFVWLNLLYLAFVALAPFPTSVISEYATAASVTLYAVQVAMLGILQGLIWWYAHRKGLLAKSVDEGIYRYQLIGSLVTPVVFLVTIPIAVFLSPAAAVWSWLSLVVIGPLVDRVSRQRVDRADAASR
jgi:uncharacterized membrane protein